MRATVAVATISLISQTAVSQTPTQPGALVPPPPPATKLEAFKPAAGSVLTLGYNVLGKVSGVSVEEREMRDSKGGIVRGVVVDVTQGEYREERSFIDADELPELIKGIDALLAVKTNPTPFQNFEVRYTTQGELQITAYNNDTQVRYAVQAGRVLKAQVFTDADGIRRLQTMFQKAQEQLSVAIPATNSKCLTDAAANILPQSLGSAVSGIRLLTLRVISSTQSLSTGTL